MRSAGPSPTVQVLLRSRPQLPDEPPASCDIHRRNCRTEPRGRQCERARNSGGGYPRRTHHAQPALRRIEADVDKIDPESVELRIPHGFESPPARQRRFDRETHLPAEVILNPANDFATAGDGGLARIGWVQPRRNCVSVNQVFASAKSNVLVIVLFPDPFGPAMAVRTGNCQAVGANSRMISKFRPRGAPGMKRISKRRASGCSMISISVRSFR